MGTRWIPGAERLGDGKIGGAMDTSGLPPRVVWHSTESGNGDKSFNGVRDYLINIGAEPHILYDPVTDRLGQYGPLDESARALRNDGGSRTNRTGRVCIQIEVLARAKTPFTNYWKPGKNFRALMAAIRSWGVPDRFPMGAPPVYPGGSRRTRSVWQSEAGHYCHANIPGNNHGDPGAISPSKLFAAAPGGSTGGGSDKPKPPAYPGSAKVRYGASGPQVLAVDKALIRKGYGRYLTSGPSDYYGKTTRAGVKAFQKDQGWTGTDADGNVGPETWRRLMK